MAIMKLFLGSILLLSCQAFLSGHHGPQRTALFAKKRISMAEKRRRRGGKQMTQVLPERVPRAIVEESEETAVAPPAPESKQAQKLLEAQRASVNTLTRIKTSMEALPAMTDAYLVVDNFLQDDTLIDAIAGEGSRLFEAGMAPDMSRLGLGEYTVALEGGADQYALSPRSIEFVVSATKHIPMEGLDTSNCQATMRTFDRDALQASAALLTGSTEVHDTGSLGLVVEDPDMDIRRLSLRYYAVPSTWKAELGGGLVFEDGTVDVVRDRLVLWRSASTLYRPAVWKGSDTDVRASCIELHFVQAPEEDKA